MRSPHSPPRLAASKVLTSNCKGSFAPAPEELEERNAALGLSLAENERMRWALSRILEALPSGVIVLDARGQM